MSTVSDPDTLARLALEDLQGNRPDAAEQKCLLALEANRSHPLALTVLGLLLHMRARHEDAVRVFNALTLLEPNDFRHWMNLGTALRPTRRYSQALAAHERALQLGPASAGLLYNLGVVQRDLCQYEAASATLTRALAEAPREASLRRLLAQCCYDTGDFEQAVALLEDWPTLQGLTAEERAQIAHLLVTLGEARRAEPLLRELADSASGGWQSSVVGVRLLERVNRLGEARAALDRFKASAGALSSDPDLLLAEAALAEREDQHERARECLTLALRDHSDFPRRHNLLFPLARALDALGRYEEAFRTLEEAHRSQLAFLTAVIGRAPADELAAMALTERGCDPDDVRSWDEADAPPIEESPVFIVGFPRSGTTLLEQALDAHPQLQSMDEQPFLKRAQDEMSDLGLRCPEELGKLDAAQRRILRRQYFERVRRRIELRPGERVVDKNPLNMLRLPLLRRLFPKAPVVLAIRHPCDVVLSCFMQQFRAPDLALMCRDLPRLAVGYRSAFDFWYAQCSLLRPLSYELKYESLVGDFDAELRRLAEFLHLPWDDAMLAPGEHARAKGFISTPSYAQVLEEVSNRAVGRWRNYTGHFQPALSELSPYIERWNYEA